jgi:hypothetical protein
VAIDLVEAIERRDLRTLLGREITTDRERVKHPQAHQPEPSEDGEPSFVRLVHHAWAAGINGMQLQTKLTTTPTSNEHCWHC